MKPPHEILHGKIDGKNIYCRIPIRRKRVPLFPDEFRDMLECQAEKGLSDIAIAEMAQELWQAEDYEHAGLLYSYLDFLKVMQIVEVTP